MLTALFARIIFSESHQSMYKEKKMKLFCEEAVKLSEMILLRAVVYKSQVTVILL